MLDEGAKLVCEEVVRVVPGKRVVLRGSWQGQPVYAKLFLGKQAQRYAGRDQRGVEALQAAGIATPTLLSTTTISNETVVLVFAAVADSVNTEQAWAAMGVEQRRALADELVAEVARHHAAGLLQSDLYLKNFLLQGPRVLTLDGDAIRLLPRFLRERAAQINLARLISKFDIEHEAEWLPALLARYAEVRGLPVVPDLSSMRRRIAAMRRSNTQRYAERKVFRQCTDVEVQRSLGRFTAITRGGTDEQTRQALASPELLLHVPERLLKQGNTCTVALASIGARKVVVKRYNIKNFWHGLGRAWRRSRAAISWSNAHRLGMYDIATPLPLALVENRRGPLRRAAWFISQYMEAPDAATFFADANRTGVEKAEAVERIAQLFHKLYLLQLVHGDLKASNILVKDGRPVLIDLDAMHHYRCRHWFRRRHARDLRRFMQNWQRDVAMRQLFVRTLGRVYQDRHLLQQAGIE
ncbi:MAG TPA: lipopolysaccharide kinase InaA family protein [Methylophilaceae bacterium]|nr:lipopolysaccharide kinase InaA family protein [Methylophilaceae bacterium]